MNVLLYINVILLFSDTLCSQLLAARDSRFRFAGCLIV